LSAARFDDFNYADRFDAIIMPAGSFTLIPEFESAMEMLARIRDHSAPGGSLIIDIPPLSVLAANVDDRRQWNGPDGEFLTLEGVRVETDWGAQRSRTRYRYERWREGTLVETQIDMMAQRHWGREEFGLALKAAGFSDITCIGNYTRGRPARSNDRIFTFIATPAPRP